MIKNADDYQIVRNALNCGMRKSSHNWVKVQDILLTGTTHSGSTSSIEKCREIGVDPWGRKWEKAVPMEEKK